MKCQSHRPDGSRRCKETSQTSLPNGREDVSAEKTADDKCGYRRKGLFGTFLSDFIALQLHFAFHINFFCTFWKEGVQIFSP